MAEYAEFLKSLPFDELRALSDIGERVNEGSSLADTMTRYPKVFPPLYVNMVRAGEASGALDRVLNRIARYLTWSRGMRATTLQALSNPRC